MIEEKESEEGKEPSVTGDSNQKGDLARYAALTSTPYILIVYPIVGFIVGYLPVYYWGWSIIISVVLMVLGLVQGIREVIKIGNRFEN